MSNPNIPPPSYVVGSPPKTQYGSTETEQLNNSSSSKPLLPQQQSQQYKNQSPQYASGSNAPRNDWLGEGDEDSIVDDFQVSFMTLFQNQ